MTRHLDGGRESSYVGQKNYRFLESLLSNVPCLRINIALILISQAKNSLISRKTQKQMFLLISGGHICAPEKETNMVMASPHKAL